MNLERIEVKNPMGIVTDIPSGDLPLEGWSDGNNISFRNGKVIKAQGMDNALDLGFMPIGLQQYITEGTPYWIVGSSDKLWRTEGSSPVDLSRTGAAYDATADNPWNGGVLHQVSIMNNGKDLPQALLPSATQYVDLPNWPTTLRAKVVRPFKNYLIALNVTKNSAEYPTMIKWSSPADPGTVPTTWNEADPTNDAGEYALSDTPGQIVDGVKLKDSFIVYKEDASYLMRYVGGLYIFAFQQLFNDAGMLAKGCAAEFDGFHFVVGQGDVYVHNGVQKRSVIDGKVRTVLFEQIHPNFYHRTFVVPDYDKMEMWVCFPDQTSGDGLCNRAFIWNWQDNSWSFRDIPFLFCGSTGVVDPQVPGYWGADDDQWATDTSMWTSSAYNAAKRTLLFAAPAASALYSLGSTSTLAGIPYSSYLERTGIYLGDNRNMKTVTSVVPHLSGSGTCNIYVGSSNTQSGGTKWKGPYPYNIGTSYKIDCKNVGRYVSVRFVFPDAGSWSLNGYTVELFQNAGIR